LRSFSMPSGKTPMTVRLSPPSCGISAAETVGRVNCSGRDKLLLHRGPSTRQTPCNWIADLPKLGRAWPKLATMGLSESRKERLLGRYHSSRPGRKRDNAKISIGISVGPHFPDGICRRSSLSELITRAAHSLSRRAEGVSGDREGNTRIDPDAWNIDEVPSIEYLPRVYEAFCLGDLTVRNRDAVEGILDKQAGFFAISREHIPTRGIRSTVVRGKPDDFPCEVWRKGLQCGPRSRPAFSGK
jgi:hypothetical protein